MIDLKNIKEKTAESLRQTATFVKEISVVKNESISFLVSEIANKESADDLLDQIKLKINDKDFNQIYYFKADATSYDLDSLLTCYKKAKAQKMNNRAYARLNKISPYLYVGSSRSLISRIKQHFGYGPEGTYAMQLIHWCNDPNLKINLTILSFDKSINRRAFQALEDGMWDELKPMLGRKGPK